MGKVIVVTGAGGVLCSTLAKALAEKGNKIAVLDLRIEAANKVDINAATLNNKGIGPIKNITLSAIDDQLVAKGKVIYKTNCSACHKFKKRYIGPALKGITKRRSPEWIMNMILNPDEMLKKDPVGKALIKEYNAPMANQQLKESDVRAILEYFRTKN